MEAVTAIIPCSTQGALAVALAGIMRGHHVPRAAYPNTVTQQFGLLFAPGAPDLCIEFSFRQSPLNLTVRLALCARRRAGVELLDVIYAKKFTYPATDDIDAIAQDASAQFWARISAPRAEENEDEGGHTFNY